MSGGSGQEETAMNLAGWADRRRPAVEVNCPPLSLAVPSTAARRDGDVVSGGSGHGETATDGTDLLVLV